MTNNVEYFSMDLFAIYIALLMKRVFKFFAYFVTALFSKISLCSEYKSFVRGFANTSS